MNNYDKKTTLLKRVAIDFDGTICENKKGSCKRFRFMILNFGFEI